MGTPEDDEARIRKTLGAQLGVEFYSPDDPEVNIDVSKPPPNKARDEFLDHVSKISVSELITKCADATKLMSKSNPHRILLWNCAFALRQLVDRLEAKTQ